MQFMDIVNEVIRHFNDVELTQQSFANTVGFQSVVKDSVNLALATIHEQETGWPFNLDQWTETTVPLQIKYYFPDDCAKIDWRSFRVERDDTTNTPCTYLRYMEYQDYLKNNYPLDAQDDKGDIPSRAFQYSDGNWGITKRPDIAYNITYEYWKQPLDLVKWNDAPTVPDRFRYVVVFGAIAYCYRFRQNKMSADDFDNKFQQGIKTMRTQLMNRYDYVMDTRVPGR